MRILVVEDSAPIRKSVVQGLREAGYAVDEAADGDHGLRLAQGGEHDVIVLDLMLPRIDGLTVLKTLRQKRCPAHILVLTARDTSEDKVMGLEAGADDYLVKPFHFAELLARVKALIRRKYETKSTVLTIADLEVDLAGRVIRRGGQLIDLSAREYALLEYLALNAARIVSRSEIWQHVYDVNALPESNVVDVFVGRVRAKIEQPGKARLIHTRRGQGYFLGLLSQSDEVQ
jgi:two-component system copper resistance phosphate regulon response regulator CusR